LVSRYTVSPSLPAGLVFNERDGSISGVPTEVSGESVYTVTASNSGGSTRTVLTVVVKPKTVLPSLTWGQCPKPSAGSFGVCSQDCASNSDCKAGLLCCSNGCGHTCMAPDDGCHAVSTSKEEPGYEDQYQGWYDVQGCGKCNDYCRWVGASLSGGDPALRLTFEASFWSCSLAGGSDARTPKGYFSTWGHKKCKGKGAETPWTVVKDLKLPMLLEAAKMHILAAAEYYQQHFSHLKLWLSKDESDYTLIGASTLKVSFGLQFQMAILYTDSHSTTGRRAETKSFVLRPIVHRDTSGLYSLHSVLPPVDGKEYQNLLGSYHGDTLRVNSLSTLDGAATTDGGSSGLHSWEYGLVAAGCVLAAVAVVAALIWSGKHPATEITAELEQPVDGKEQVPEAVDARSRASSVQVMDIAPPETKGTALPSDPIQGAVCDGPVGNDAMQMQVSDEEADCGITGKSYWNHGVICLD